jgi:carbamoyl-phosphate synthase large subunit
MTTTTTKQSILIIGGGQNDFAREGEVDAAILKVIQTLEEQGLDIILTDDNPVAIALESPQITTIWQPLTIVNIQNLIERYQPTYLLPFLGGEKAWRLTTQLVEEWELLSSQDLPTILGVPSETLPRYTNPTILMNHLGTQNLPVIQNHTIDSVDEAFDLLREFELPMMAKALNPSQENTRRLIERADDFEPVIRNVFEQSLTQQVVLSQSISGFKEINMALMRDQAGTHLQIGASEDMDPIGIHTHDSLSVTPIVTLSDRNVQRMWHYAFQVADALQIIGALHVQFAIDETSHDIYLTKVTPYIDRYMAFVERATGYPLVQVATQLALGRPLTTVKLSDEFTPQAALMVPMMDHFVVQLPIFQFGELQAAGIQVNRQLSTIQKSVGATFGIGRTFIEALEKAIRAAHFNNASFSPTYMQTFSDDELIQQLIHPQDNRVLLLIEAIRRGYEVDELAELTAIDEFYFYQLQQLDALESEVIDRPFDTETLRKAKTYGLSDGLIARFWQTTFDFIRQSTYDKAIHVTYKAIEPSAGEFPDYARQFYSTFERENESRQLSEQAALVIGSGAFRLGDGAAAGYATNLTLLALKRRGYRTIVMNNNAHDATLLAGASDKQYLEPLEISDVMNVVAIEQPTVIFVPGNRQKLIHALREQGQNVAVLPKTKHVQPGPEEHTDIQWQVVSYDGHNRQYLTNLVQSANTVSMAQPDTLSDATIQLVQAQEPGIYQINPDTQHIEPLSYLWLAYLSKTWQLSLIDWLVGAQLGEQIAIDAPQLQHHYVLQMAQPHFVLHLQPNVAINTTQFAMGATIRLPKNGQ